DQSKVLSRLDLLHGDLYTEVVDHHVLKLSDLIKRAEVKCKIARILNARIPVGCTIVLRIWPYHNLFQWVILNIPHQLLAIWIVVERKYYIHQTPRFTFL